MEILYKVNLKKIKFKRFYFNKDIAAKMEQSNKHQKQNKFYIKVNKNIKSYVKIKIPYWLVLII